jgi:hypothetical protein
MRTPPVKAALAASYVPPTRITVFTAVARTNGPAGRSSTIGLVSPTSTESCTADVRLLN